MWNTDDEYLTGMTLRQVAKVLGLSYPTVFHMATVDKKLEAVQVVGTWLVNPESVKSYKKLLDTKRMLDQHRYL